MDDVLDACKSLASRYIIANKKPFAPFNASVLVVDAWREVGSLGTEAPAVSPNIAGRSVGIRSLAEAWYRCLFQGGPLCRVPLLAMPDVQKRALLQLI